MIKEKLFRTEGGKLLEKIDIPDNERIPKSKSILNEDSSSKPDGEVQRT